MSGAGTSVHLRRGAEHKLRGRASAVGLDHLPQLPLEICNLVAQPGGKFELQIGRGGVHLGGQLLHQVGKITGR